MVTFVSIIIRRATKQEHETLQKTLKERETSLRSIEKIKYQLEQQQFALDQHSLVTTSNVDGVVTYVNDQFCNRTGYNRKEIIGNKSEQLLVADFNEQFWNSVYEQLKKGIVWHGETKNTTKNKDIIWLDTTIVPFKDKNGEVISFISIRTDITERHMAEEKLTYQASHDALTGLANRIEFERRLKQLLQRSANKETHALLYLDLDQFKIINDTCGHHAGDELLRQIPKIISQHIRNSDLLARLGGDEFAIILDHCNLEKTLSISESIIKSVSEWIFNWQGDNFRVGVSIGVIMIEDHMNDAQEVLKQVDTACFAAKDAGRNAYHLYQASDEQLILKQEEMSWIAKIEFALQNDTFCLFAQPIQKISNTKQINYEILLRMRGDNETLISPTIFLSAAERFDKMVEIDYWVINSAFDTLNKYLDSLEHTDYFSINLSGLSLTNNNFVLFLINKLKANSQLAQKVCFEITESAAISNINSAIVSINKFKKLGARFALDDFGKGFSSLEYLRSLPVDYLKIDGLFIANIAHDQINHAMVNSIIEIAKIMNMQTVAEFVEDKETLEMVKFIGIDYAQGYEIGRPAPIELFLESL